MAILNDPDELNKFLNALLRSRGTIPNELELTVSGGLCNLEEIKEIPVMGSEPELVLPTEYTYNVKGRMMSSDGVTWKDSKVTTQFDDSSM